jgi:hypothetical protein
MDHATLDKEILKILSAVQRGASTRHLANRILAEKLAGGTIVPGKDKMGLVYSRLVRMKRSGKVFASSPGYWQIKRDQG